MLIGIERDRKSRCVRGARVEVGVTLGVFVSEVVAVVVLVRVGEVKMDLG